MLYLKNNLIVFFIKYKIINNHFYLIFYVCLLKTYKSLDN